MRPTAEFYRQLGERIKQARIAKGWSIREFADKLGNKYGTSTLSRYERGDPNVAERETLNDLCDALGLNADDLYSEIEMQNILQEMQDEKDEDILQLHKHWGDEAVKLMQTYDRLNNYDKAALVRYAEFLLKQAQERLSKEGK